MLVLNLQKLRKSKHLKQNELGDLLGIKQAYMSELESGKKPIPQDIYNKIKSEFSDAEDFLEDVVDTEPTLIMAFEIMKKQADSLERKDQQMDRLITLLENQLNK